MSAGAALLLAALAHAWDPSQPAATGSPGAAVGAAKDWLAGPGSTDATGLFVLFARSRFGDLPEDPDLFEAALRRLLLLDDEALARGYREGLRPALLRLAWAELHRRHLAAAFAHNPARAAALAEWPAAHPSARAAAEARASALLDAAFATHGRALVAAFSPMAGSAAHAAADHARESLLLALIDAEGPTVAAPLGAALPATELWTPAVAAALAAHGVRPPGAPAPRPLPPVAPPALAPGHSPGLEPGPPTAPAGAHGRPGPGPRPPLLPRVALAAFATAAAAGALAVRAPRLRSLRALSLAAALLAGAEAALRLVAPPPARPLVTLHEAPAELVGAVPGAPGLVETGGGAIRHRRFAATPAPGTLRIAALGESSVHGSHLLADEAFPACIERALPARLGVPVEVLNFGVGGTLSDGVRQAGEAALALGAHLLIVYTGHNEVAQLAALARWDLSLPRLQARAILGRSAMFALLRRVVPAPARAAKPLHGRPPATRADVARLARLAVENHRWNLSLLLDAAARAGAPVVLSTVATNYRFAHLQPHATPGPGDGPDIAARIAAAEDHSRAGRHPEARAALQSAIDAAASPREATQPINDATRALAQAYDTPLLDATALLYDGSPDGLTVSGLFWDDVHPTAAGHARLAEGFLPLVEGAARPLLATLR